MLLALSYFSGFRLGGVRLSYWEGIWRGFGWRALLRVGRASDEILGVRVRYLAGLIM